MGRYDRLLPSTRFLIFNDQHARHDAHDLLFLLLIFLLVIYASIGLWEFRFKQREEQNIQVGYPGTNSQR